MRVQRAVGVGGCRRRGQEGQRGVKLGADIKAEVVTSPHPFPFIPQIGALFARPFRHLPRPLGKGRDVNKSDLSL